jgi:hypothetical protein
LFFPANRLILPIVKILLPNGPFFPSPSFPILFLCFLGLTPSGASGLILSGKILEKGTKAPILGASLYLETVGNTRPAGTTLPVLVASPGPVPSGSMTPFISPNGGAAVTENAFTTDADLKGNYTVTVPPGTYRLAVAGTGYSKISIPAVEIQGDLTKDFYLQRDGFALPEVVVSTSKEPKTEVSHEVLSKEELTAVAGSLGDVLRAVQTLPGVINAGIESGQLLIRGSGPEDNLYLVDRIPISFPFHFGGAISTLDSSLIKDVDFMAGGFGPQYGNAMGGVVDTDERDPRSDRWGFRADVNLLMSEAEIEGPVTSDSSLVIAGRRSYLDLLIGNLSSNSFTAIPVFGDYQVKYSYNPSPTVHWDFDAFGSTDKVGVDINGNYAEQDPVLGGNFNFEDGYAGQGINFHDITGAQDGFWNTLYHFNSYLDESFGGGLYLDCTLEDFGDWFTWKHDFNNDTQLEAGLQADALINGTNAYLPVYPTEYDPSFTATAANKVTANDTVSSGDMGAYFNQKFKWFDQKLRVSAGARIDYLTSDSRAVLAPRFSAAYLLSGQTTLKASYGYYDESPSRIEGSTYLDPSLGNPHLGPEQSISTVLGIEQKLQKGLDLRVEGYEKNFSQLIVYDPAVNYGNSGTGTARGMEIFLRKEPTDRFFGWISYSLSQSLRQDGSGLPVYVYDFDEPNILTVVANYKLNPGWDAGFKWLYSSGLPITPVLLGEASAAPATVNGSPVTYYDPKTGPVNSQRLPDYIRLDLSTSFSTVYDTWEWRLYFDIINVLHNQDVLGYQYNSDYTQQTAVLDLPFLPYIGFEAKY